MPRARHAAIQILDHFTTADLAAADQLLQLCKQVLGVRQEGVRSKSAPPKKRRRRTKAEMAAAGTAVMTRSEKAVRRGTYRKDTPPVSEALPLGQPAPRLPRPRPSRPVGIPSAPPPATEG